MNLKKIIEESDTKWGRVFDFAIQGLVLLSLISFSVETLPNLSPASRIALDWVETVTVGLFTVEYALRIIVAERKRSFLFSFFGLVDLVAILPFYLALGIDLRSIRIVRFMRIFRILKIARYSLAIRRIQIAMRIAREELILFSSAALMLLYFSAVGIYYFERDAQPEQFASIFHGLWWAVATLTTVGYGDVFPITTGGRVFTFFILLIGLGIVAVPTGLLASALSKARDLEAEKMPSTRQVEEGDRS